MVAGTGCCQVPPGMCTHATHVSTTTACMMYTYMYHVYMLWVALHVCHMNLCYTCHVWCVRVLYELCESVTCTYALCMSDVCMCVHTCVGMHICHVKSPEMGGADSCRGWAVGHPPGWGVGRGWLLEVALTGFPPLPPQGTCPTACTPWRPCWPPLASVPSGAPRLRISA